MLITVITISTRGIETRSHGSSFSPPFPMTAVTFASVSHPRGSNVNSPIKHLSSDCWARLSCEINVVRWHANEIKFNYESHKARKTTLPPRGELSNCLNAFTSRPRLIT